jgi:Fe-S-cluster containining protein
MGRNAKLKKARREAPVQPPKSGNVTEAWVERLDNTCRVVTARIAACVARVLNGTYDDTIEGFADAINDERNNPHLKAELDTLWKGLPGMQMACRQGCSYCCHQDVWVTILDLYLLCREIHKQGRAEAVAAACEAIEDLRSKERFSLAQDQPIHMDAAPCPLLDTATGSCSVYASRPAICRSFHSVSLASCKAWFQDSTQVVWQNGSLLAPDTLQCNTTEQAVEMLGCETLWTSLNRALPTALREPERFDRWWDGELGVWADVLLPEGQNKIDDASIKALRDQDVHLQLPPELEPAMQARLARREAPAA